MGGCVNAKDDPQQSTNYPRRAPLPAKSLKKGSKGPANPYLPEEQIQEEQHQDQANPYRQDNPYRQESQVKMSQYEDQMKQLQREREMMKQVQNMKIKLEQQKFEYEKKLFETMENTRKIVAERERKEKQLNERLNGDKQKEKGKDREYQETRQREKQRERQREKQFQRQRQKQMQRQRLNEKRLKQQHKQIQIQKEQMRQLLQKQRQLSRLKQQQNELRISVDVKKRMELPVSIGSSGESQQVGRSKIFDDKTTMERQQQDYFQWDPLTMLISCTENSFTHSNIVCEECRIKNFSGIRLSYLMGEGDLCANCFEKPRKRMKQPLTVIQNQLNAHGEARLSALREMIQSGEESQPGISWHSFCNQCEHFRQSIFFIDVKQGKSLCLGCFKDNYDYITNPHVVQLFPPALHIDADKFDVDSLGHGFGGRIKKARHKASGRQFSLSKVEIKVGDINAYRRTRTQLLRFKGNHILNVYAHAQQKKGDHLLRVSIIQEFMPNHTLEQLVGSQTFRQFSHRRRMGIFRSLTTAIRMIHALNLFHGNLSPEFILLDVYHEVRLELLPFVNREAIVLGIQQKNQYKENRKHEDSASDIFSLGLLINLVMTGSKHKISKDGGKIEFPQKSKLFGRQIDACLNQDPKARPRADQLQAQFVRFDKTFWTEVSHKVGRKEYEKLNTAEKDRIFQQIYHSFK